MSRKCTDERRLNKSSDGGLFPTLYVFNSIVHTYRAHKTIHLNGILGIQSDASPRVHFRDEACKDAMLRGPIQGINGCHSDSSGSCKRCFIMKLWDRGNVKRVLCVIGPKLPKDAMGMHDGIMSYSVRRTGRKLLFALQSLHPLQPLQQRGASWGCGVLAQTGRSCKSRRDLSGLRRELPVRLIRHEAFKCEDGRARSDHPIPILWPVRWTKTRSWRNTCTNTSIALSY